jgi:hypothetical protein
MKTNIEISLILILHARFEDPTLVVMNRSIFWDISGKSTDVSEEHVSITVEEQNTQETNTKHCLLAAFCWYLAWLTHQP